MEVYAVYDVTCRVSSFFLTISGTFYCMMKDHDMQ